MPWTNGALNSCVGTEFYHNLVLLRCIGGKSGKPRSVALLATPLGNQFVLIASAAGHEKNPSWYYNLKANPECTLLIRNRGEIPFVAHEAEGEEREQAWNAANTLYSNLMVAYQSRVERKIPILVLTPKTQE
ncbi:MAG TPA: nitroreductase family deazaflavin-dependent oxidoreductase [Anaerolineales bacterium]|nr:nitroreductase family deazaflavin-dependent oxidoreductase [Anaerolineales bacterium]